MSARQVRAGVFGSAYSPDHRRDEHEKAEANEQILREKINVGCGLIGARSALEFRCDFNALTLRTLLLAGTTP